MMETRNNQLLGNGSRATPAVGASPYTYTNTTDRLQTAVSSGGTVSVIAISRDGVTFDTTGGVAGVFSLPPGFRLRITYTVAPTLFAVYTA